MATSSDSSTLITINFHRGGIFVRNPFHYDFDMVSQLENVDVGSMNYNGLLSFLEQQSSAIIRGLFYVVPGLDLEKGLRKLSSDAVMKNFRQHAIKNDCMIDIYSADYEFAFNDMQRDRNDVASDSEDEDHNIYDIHSSDDESETASLDHLSDCEDEIVDVRTKKKEPKTKRQVGKMFDDDFLCNIYNGLEKETETYVEKELGPVDEFDKEDEDKLGDHWPIHDPTIKWKYMIPLLGERYEGPEQLKRCITFYALANGFKMFFEVNDGKRLLVRCNKNYLGKPACTYRLWASWMQKERSFQVKTLVNEHCCSKSYEFGSLITCNWIARNYANKIMTNPRIKVREIQESILKKYKCRVTIGQCRRGKIKALEQFETCLVDHYGKLWSYAEEIITSNPGSTCLMSVETLPDGKNYFKSFYVCFKGLRDGWLDGCRKVIGLDGCFLKTVCKGEILAAVGRDGNYHIYPIAWAVVNVENKENWKWFMECLVNDLELGYGAGLTIISDQHKGLLEAAKETLPQVEHRQCARHIYANFRKKYSGVLYRNLFWKAAKATYPTKFEEITREIKNSSKEAYEHLMERMPKSWSRAFFATDRACDAVENGISECFNALIVDARKKPIINMLEDIRHMVMLRLKKMKDKQEAWNDVMCPSIRKKFEIIKDQHREWDVYPSGEAWFEVKKGHDSFKVNENLHTCSCRHWQLSGIPCAHGFSVIYFLNKNPDLYISDWFKTPKFASTYNHYIYPLNGMTMWPTVDYQKPLPPIVRRMPGRPKHKRKRDAGEGNDGNRTRLSRVGRVMHCTVCKQAGHNKITCSKPSAGGASIASEGH